MILTAIYARVSSERQEQERTIESQVAELRKAAKERGYFIAHEYIDDGFSGDLLSRPALDRLRDDAAGKKFERVLVLSPDRLSRKHVYVGLIYEELRGRSIPVEFLNQRNDETDEGRLLLGVSSLFAEYEKAKYIERCRRGRRHKVAKGQVMISLAPFGYSYIKRSGNTPGYIVVNEDQAKIVRLIFSLADKGITARQIIKELHRRKIFPQGRWGFSEYWGSTTIRRMLRNQSYIGLWHYAKAKAVAPEKKSRALLRRMVKTSRRINARTEWIPVPGAFPAIVEADVFKRVQAQIDRNAAFSPRHVKYEYLLSGLLRCGVCKRAYVGNKSTGGFLHYRCSGPRNSKPAPRNCFNPLILSKKIEPAVWQAVTNLLKNPRTLFSKMDKVVLAESGKIVDVGAQRKDIEQHRKNVKAAEERLLDAYTAGYVTPDQLKGQMDKLKEKLEKLGQREAALPEDGPAEDQEDRAMRFCRNLKRGLAIVENDFEKRRHLLRLLVDEIAFVPGKATIRGAIPGNDQTPSTEKERVDCGPTVDKVGFQSNRLPFEIQVILDGGVLAR